jgi:hypothetical protein
MNAKIRLLLILIVIFAAACMETVVDPPTPTGSEIGVCLSDHDNSVGRSAVPVGGDPWCAFAGRKPMGRIELATGMIVYDETSNDFLIRDIHYPEIRFKTCMIPDGMRKAGRTVRFSGEIMEIYPWERWTGTPLHLTWFTFTEESYPVLILSD